MKRFYLTAAMAVATAFLPGGSGQAQDRPAALQAGRENECHVEAANQCRGWAGAAYDNCWSVEYGICMSDR